MNKYITKFVNLLMATSIYNGDYAITVWYKENKIIFNILRIYKETVVMVIDVENVVTKTHTSFQFKVGHFDELETTFDKIKLINAIKMAIDWCNS